MKRVLLTNDDGIDAPGLAVLEEVVGRLVGSRIESLVVAAPREPHSGCGHRVTTDRPLAVENVGPGRHSIDGTPADCVRVALATFARDATVVLAGVNAGGNLGVDIHHSGTVAAARESALHGLPAVAFSQYHRRGRPIDWEAAGAWVARLLDEVVFRRAFLPGEFWNVNLPHVDSSPDDPPPGDPAMPPLAECPVDPSPMSLGYRLTDEGWKYEASYHDRPRRPGHDIDRCFSGAITLSRIPIG
jgi:5'-nucleotidase